jgi:hypothetical protein
VSKHCIESAFLRIPKTWLVLAIVLLAAACSKSKSAPTAPTPPAPLQLAAPALDAPSDDQQLRTLRPELIVRNGTSSETAGARSYEFQIADNTGFAPVGVTGTGVAENAGGKTSFTPTQDLRRPLRLQDDRLGRRGIRAEPALRVSRQHL